MIAITGATGNIGSKLTGHLVGRGASVRVIGRTPERLAGLVIRGAEGAIGDLGDEAFLTRAFTGAETVFAMIPPQHTADDLRAYQNRIGETIARAARSAGVTHIVNLSSQGAHLPEGTGPIAGLHDQEERLNVLTGVNVLHLRPGYFMENLLITIDLIRKMGIMGSAVRGDIRFAMIATKDIAAHAAGRLLERDFAGTAVQDLLGERDVSMQEAAVAIGAKIGIPDLQYVTFPYEDAEKAMIGMGISQDVSRRYIEMSKAMNEGRFSVGLSRDRGNTTATSIEEFADIFARAYRASSKAA